MPTISRRDLLLTLVHLTDPNGTQGLGGITRIQKLLFLLEREENILPTGDGFSFEAYKAGPYSPRVYDDLEFLENRDMLRRAVPGDKIVGPSSPPGATEPTLAELAIVDDPEASDAEKDDIDVTFNELMGPAETIGSELDEIKPTADSYEETRYYITDRGRNKIESLLANKEYEPLVQGIRKVQSRFAKYSLNDLLYYVYTRHPDMTTESEIKEKVLRRRP